MGIKTLCLLVTIFVILKIHTRGLERDGSVGKVLACASMRIRIQIPSTHVKS